MQTSIYALSGLLFLTPVSAVEVIETVPSVCLSVCEHSHSQTVGHMVTKFSTGTDLDDILDKFYGQGHGSKVKVTRSKNVIFKIIWLVCQDVKH